MKKILDYNDLNDRILRLYRCLDGFNHSHDKEYRQFNIQQENKNDGSTIIHIDLSVNNISAEEELDFKLSTSQVIQSLATLKDNTKNSMAELGKPKSIVEEYINDNLVLCIITDLDNLNKHGAPLKNAYRSKFEPQIVNLKKETKMPLFFGWFDLVTESKIYLDADLVNSQDEDKVVFGLKDLFAKALVSWEDFFIEYFPGRSDYILKRRSDDVALIKLFSDFQQLEGLALAEKNIKANWIAWNFLELRKGMVVGVFDQESGNWKTWGLIVDLIDKDKDKSTITLLEIFDTGLYQVFEASQFKWTIFFCRDSKKNTAVYDYCHRLPEMRQLAITSDYSD